MSSTTSTIPPDSFRRVFQNRNYLLLWLGQTISQIGDAISLIAVPLLVYQMTHSGLNVTLSYVLQAIPWILIGPIAGVFVDRVNRKMLLVMTDVVRMILMLFLLYTDNIVIVYLIGFLTQVMASIFAPTRSAIIPELTGPDLYVKAISLSYTSFQVVSVVGPFIAVAIITLVGGPRAGFILDALTFLVAALMSLAIRMPASSKVAPAAPTAKLNVWASFREGSVYLMTHPVLRYVTSLNLLKATVDAFIMVSLLLYVKTTLNLGDAESDRFYGIIVGFGGAGTVLGTVLINMLIKKIERRAMIIFGLVVQGIVYTLIFFEPNMVLLSAMWFIAGVAASGSIIPISAFYAESTTNEIRGRVYSATNSVIKIFSTISYLLTGLLITAVGPVNLLMIGGLVMAVLTLVLTLSLKGHKALAPAPTSGIPTTRTSKADA